MNVKISGLVPENSQTNSRQLIAALREPIHNTAGVFYSRVQGVFHTANTPKPTSDYTLLANEHAELIRQGKNSLEIAILLGDRLNITSWRT